MKIIAVDDERIALEGLLDVISEAAPDAELNGFEYPCAANDATASTVSICVSFDATYDVTSLMLLTVIFPALSPV